MSKRVPEASLRRRIVAAAQAATVRRSIVDEEMPECHRKNCQAAHGSADRAMAYMKHAIVEAIDEEMSWEKTTRPDVAEDGDTPDQAAVLTLAVLLGRYRVNDAGTYMNAAQLIVDAYPALIPVLAGIKED